MNVPVQLSKNLTTSAKRAGVQMVANARFMVWMVGLLWMLFILDKVLPAPYTLKVLGIQPRSLWGLPGIVLAPLVHKDWGHISSNTVPLLVLGWVMLLGGRRLFFKANLVIIPVAGLIPWLFGGSGTLHFGASGVIYGYLGFLLFRGFLEPSARWIVVAVVVGSLYATMLKGFLPTEAVSTSAHLGGFFGGAAAAWLFFYWPRRQKELAVLRKKR